MMAAEPMLHVDQIRSAYMELACPQLQPMLDFFIQQLAFRVEAIFPADEPHTALISGYGLNLYLKQEASVSNPGVLRLLCTHPEQLLNGQTQLTAPNGLQIRVDHADPPLIQPPTLQELVVSKTQDSAHWGMGRAGLRYRDLLPNRHGGAFIASHIRVLGGGPVPDYVHYHKVRFQVIYCRTGWVRVVYEGQGEPFVMNAGDCVLQPPLIRHRVLESSAGAEVVEIASPAQHITMADPDMSLPNAALPASHDFSGQRFVRHIAQGATWQAWRANGFLMRDTGIAQATDGLAAVRCVQTQHASTAPMSALDTEFCFYFVLQGQLSVALLEQTHRLLPDDCISLPRGMAHTLHTDAGTEFLEILFPADPSLL